MCRAVLKLLKDANSEVQGMATKCLPPLTSFVDLDNAVYVVENLLDFILVKTSNRNSSSTPDLVGQKATRDVASLALKSILRRLSPNSAKAPRIANAILPPLVSTISSAVLDPNSTETLIDTVELLYELITRVGSLLSAHHKRICEALFMLFSFKSALVRKRAISCLASLAAVSGNSLFVVIVERSLSHLQKPRSHDAVRTGIQAISALSKTAGHRLAPHLPVLVPILFEYASSTVHSEDDDLREHCLQALASFCLRCRREMVSFAEKLADVAVTLAKYDPNYILDDDDENEDEGVTGDADDDDDLADDYDDDDYSDDDDSSWKVRRAAIGCIHALISSQLLPLSQLASLFGPFLISRFREREESVKLDVFSAFDQLLRLCGGRSLEPFLNFGAITALHDAEDATTADNTSSDEIQNLASHGNQLIRGLKRELCSRSAKTKIRAMWLVRSVVLSLSMLVRPLVSSIIEEIKQGVSDQATGMRTETLLVLQTVVRVGGAHPVVEHIQSLVPCVLRAAGDRYYKVTAECMRFFEAVVSASGSSPELRRKLEDNVSSIYDAALQRATAQDQDSEVKEAALRLLVSAVTNVSEDLGSQRIKALISVLSTRLMNPGTQISTVRHFHAILLSKKSANFVVSELNDITPVVSSFLRKSDQTLRRSALELLTVVPVLPPNNDAALIDNISELISDTDLQIASLALDVSTKVVKDRDASVIELIAMRGSIYPRALSLSMSPLLQGRSVDSLLALFSSLARSNVKPITIQDMLQALEDQAEDVSFGITTSSARSSPLYCIAKCIVTVCREAETDLRVHTTQRIIGNINSQDFKSRIFALACLAEFGRGSLLPKEGNEKEIVRKAVINALDAPVEEVKTAAAVALGGLASADGASGVPLLVSLIKERGAQRYILLLSLKEAISSVDQSHLASIAPAILPLLLEQPAIERSENARGNNAEAKRGRLSEEESVRTATAECLGLLAEACPEVVMVTLKSAAMSQSADVRAAVASAVKFAVTSSTISGVMPSSQLRSNLYVFIQMIGDLDVMVAKNAVQLVNAVAKSHPKLLFPHLSKTLPLIYARTSKNKELVQIVDLGPFKHEEDYGLDLRKCAFDCLRTLMSGPLCSSIPVVGLLEHVVVGLQDQADVRSIAQLILMAAANSENASQMVIVIDSIVMALKATLSERLKENTVRQEVERHEESIRGALRAIRAMEAVPEIAASASFQSMMTDVIRTPKLLERYDAIAQHEINLLSMNAANRNGDFLGTFNSGDELMRD